MLRGMLQDYQRVPGLPWSRPHHIASAKVGESPRKNADKSENLGLMVWLIILGLPRNVQKR